MKKTTDDDLKPTMSEEMKRKCKDEIRKFGFSFPQYDKFLVSVAAMNLNGSVIQYPNGQILEYRDEFIKKLEHGIGDTFMFDKISKIKTSGEHGSHETGWFCPRSFWDYILQQK